MNHEASLAKTLIAFIGGGNMATAMIRGLLHGQAGLAPKQIRAADPHPEARKQLAEHFPGLVVGNHNPTIVAGAEMVVIAVKPGLVGRVLVEIAPHLSPSAVVVSIAAGIPTSTLTDLLPAGQPVVRVMPNTPALIGAGISVLFADPAQPPTAIALARSLLASVGTVEEVGTESLLDGVTALSGSGPAYVYLIAEALSDGGVACGLPRMLADRLAAQTLIGSAQLIQTSRKHPGELKNQVTSPAGTTIAGLIKLEQAGVRGALIAAVVAAWQRARELNHG